jgi:putative transposase
VLYVIPSIKQRVCFRLRALQERVWRWIKPPVTSLVPATFADLTRGKAELLAENALLRHQLIILHRQIKRPVYRKTDRVLLVLLARNDQLDQGDGSKQSALGSRTYPW